MLRLKLENLQKKHTLTQGPYKLLARENIGDSTDIDKSAVVCSGATVGNSVRMFKDVLIQTNGVVPDARPEMQPTNRISARPKCDRSQATRL